MRRESLVEVLADLCLSARLLPSSSTAVRPTRRLHRTTANKPPPARKRVITDEHRDRPLVLI